MAFADIFWVVMLASFTCESVSIRSLLPASDFVTFTRSIPHTGHEPGLSETTGGCMGQVYVSSESCVCPSCAVSDCCFEHVLNRSNVRIKMYDAFILIVRLDEVFGIDEVLRISGNLVGGGET